MESLTIIEFRYYSFLLRESIKLREYYTNTLEFTVPSEYHQKAYKASSITKSIKRTQL